MDNLVHTLVGLTASKAGLEKLSPLATPVCIFAANAPDLDVLTGFFGDRWTVLHYHRGLTHSIAGTFALALIIPSIFYLGDLLIARVRARPRRVRLRGLLLASLIASATHPLMDWTNNYGVRLWLPWSNKWFYGDLEFIVDPFLWLVFGAAAFLLTSKSKWQLVLWSSFAAILSFVVVYAGAIRGALDHPRIALTIWFGVLIVLVISRTRRIDQRFGGKIALAAFALVALYWGCLALLHQRALNMARNDATVLVATRGEKIITLAAMPMLANPVHWQCVAETDVAVYRFDLFLDSDLNSAPRAVRFEKPNATTAETIAAAARDRRTRIFLEFARFPIERVVDRDCVTQTLVQFADLRYTEPGRRRSNFSLEVPVDCPGNAVTTTDGR